MAGRRPNAGRPRKSDELKIAKGTYREDRSGVLDLKPDLSGDIDKPEFVNAHASDMWDNEVAKLIDSGVIKPTDIAMARSMCQMWGLYCDCYAAAESNPVDKDTRIAVCSYWSKFEQAAARFGMNPSDRGRLRIDKPKEGVRRREAN